MSEYENMSPVDGHGDNKSIFSEGGVNDLYNGLTDQIHEIRDANAGSTEVAETRTRQMNDALRSVEQTIHNRIRGLDDSVGKSTRALEVLEMRMESIGKKIQDLYKKVSGSAMKENETSILSTEGSNQKSSTSSVSSNESLLPNRDLHRGSDLLKAAMQGRTKVVQELLDGGVDVNVCDESQSTALHLASGVGHRETVALLLERGAEVNARNTDGMTPLHCAVTNNSSAPCIAWLTGAGAFVNCRDNNGCSPLHLAASRSNACAVKELLRVGASKTLKNNVGQTACDVAKGSDVLRHLS